MTSTPRVDAIAGAAIGTPLLTEARKLERELAHTKHLLFSVLHQRTGALGLKVEDDLLRENEPLLLECIKATRNQ